MPVKGVPVVVAWDGNFETVCAAEVAVVVSNRRQIYEVNGQAAWIPVAFRVTLKVVMEGQVNERVVRIKPVQPKRTRKQRVLLTQYEASEEEVLADQNVVLGTPCAEQREIKVQVVKVQTRPGPVWWGQGWDKVPHSVMGTFVTVKV